MFTKAPRRYVLAAGAAVCVLIVVVLAVMVRSRWAPFQDLDTDIDTPAEAWSFHHPAVVDVLVAIEIAFWTLRPSCT